MTELPRVVFTDYNPYEGRYPGRAVISREALLLAKRFRLAGYEVALSSRTDHVAFSIRKGFTDLIGDPILLKIAGTTSTIALSVVSAWIYDLLKRVGKEPPVPDDLDVVIEIEEDGRRVRYDHVGREISDERFEMILDAMQRRRDEYASSLRAVAPDPALPIPLYVEHSTKIVGWGNLKLSDGSLAVHPVHITDAQTRDRIKRGELRGFSIAGIVSEAVCKECQKDSRECDHGVDADVPCLTELKKVDLCEISIVRAPVNPRCEFNIVPPLDELRPAGQRPSCEPESNA